VWALVRECLRVRARAPVSARVQELTGQGVPLDHAINQASIEHVGGKPTIGTVTRDFAEQQAEKEGAKLPTAEGAALRERAAGNNAALHSTTQQTIENLGGRPAEGDAGELAAQSLAKASDAQYAKVKTAYNAADQEAANLKGQTDQRTQVAWDAHNAKVAEIQAQHDAEVARVKALIGPQAASHIPAPELPPAPKGMSAPGYIGTGPLQEALASPEFANPTVEGAKTLKNGVQGLLNAYAGKDGNINLKQAETLRQAINHAFDPMGGGVNHFVGQLKAALDKSLEGTESGPAYKAARAAYKDWASKYDDPAHLEHLIRRDAAGNFVNEDDWRKTTDRLLGSGGDKAFTQVVRQLQANGDQAALNKLKAEVLQRAYEKAKGNVRDQEGNGIFSGHQWEEYLTRTIGPKKLGLLFTKDELAHISTIGRAARALNEAVPHAVNGSNTASALANALRAAGVKPESGTIGKAVRMGAHLIAGHSVPGVGNLAVEAAANTASARGAASAQRKLAEAIQRNLDPSAARQAANENSIMEQATAQRKAQAEALAQALAAPLSTRKGRK
jgi:hypothetical protein